MYGMGAKILRTYRASIAFMLGLVLRARNRCIIFPILFVSLCRVTLFVRIRLMVNLRTSVLIRAMRDTSTRYTLNRINLKNRTIFGTSLVPFRLNIKVVGIMFRSNEREDNSSIIRRVRGMTSREALRRKILQFVNQTYPYIKTFTATNSAQLYAWRSFATRTYHSPAIFR